MSTHTDTWNATEDTLSTVASWMADDQALNYIRGGVHDTQQDAGDGHGILMKQMPGERQGADVRAPTTRKLIRRYDASHNQTRYNTGGTVVLADLATGARKSLGDLYYGVAALSTAGAASGGFAAHRVIAGLATHTQDANDGHGERVLSDHASSVHHVYAYTGAGSQETHAFDTTGHTLPSGGRLDGTVIGGHTRVYSPSGVVQLDVNVANPHAMTATQHVFPLGHTIEASVLSKVVITKNGTDPGVRSDSHSVVTAVISFGGTVTVGAGASTPVQFTSTFANSDYMFKTPGVSVWDTGSSNPGIYGMNYCHPSKNGGLGGGYWNGSLSTNLLWAATFVNVDGTFQVYLNNTSGGNISVNLAAYFQTVNN